MSVIFKNLNLCQSIILKSSKLTFFLSQNSLVSDMKSRYTGVAILHFTGLSQLETLTQKSIVTQIPHQIYGGCAFMDGQQFESNESVSRTQMQDSFEVCRRLGSLEWLRRVSECSRGISPVHCMELFRFHRNPRCWITNVVVHQSPRVKDFGVYGLELTASNLCSIHL